MARGRRYGEEIEDSKRIWKKKKEQERTNAKGGKKCESSVIQIS